MSNLLDLFVPPNNNDNSEHYTSSSNIINGESEEILATSDTNEENENNYENDSNDNEDIYIESSNNEIYSEIDDTDPINAYNNIKIDANAYNNTTKPIKKKRTLLNLFRQNSDKSFVNDNDNSRYTFTNTVVGSYPDELAKDLERDVKERKEHQKLKIEEASNNRFHHKNHNSSLRRLFLKIKHNLASRHNILLFLTIMGILTGSVGFGMEVIISFIHRGHLALTYTTDIWIVQFILFSIYLLIFLSISILAVRKISLSAMGSGIPEMKSILSGVILLEYLSFRTLIAKIIGLTCAIGSGMIVGKEGPFVHTASIITNQLFSIPLFRLIGNSEQLKQQMFTCAIAAGVAGNFGAPIGGLLFSIEVTSTYYPVRNYFLSAWAAIFSSFTFRTLFNVTQGFPIFNAIAPTFFSREQVVVGVLDLIGSVLLGITGGVIGSLFIFLHLTIIKIRRKGATKSRLFKSPYPYTILVASITIILTFPELIGPYMRLGPIPAFSQLASIGDLPSDWLVLNYWISVPLYLLSRFWLTALTISLPIPCGLFVPIITVGSGIGRLLGEVLSTIEQALKFGAGNELAGIMSVIGAASVGAGVTQTFSVAVIIFELTGQMALLVPVTITVVIAMAVSRSLSYNVYDGILKSRNLPYLPDINTKGHSLRAVDIMNTSIITDQLFLARKVNYKQLVTILKSTDTLSHIAVVDAYESMNLLGIVSKPTLQEVLNNFRQESLGVEADEYDNQKSWQNDVTKSIISVTKAFNITNHKSNKNYSNSTQTNRNSLFQGEIFIPYEYNPVQLQPSTPLTAVHLLFITLRLRNAYVTMNGRLMGVITRNDMISLIHDDSIFEWLMK